MGRNSLQDGGWVLTKVDDLAACSEFDCGDDDLNEYFHKDVLNHRRELLTQTYCLYESTSPKLILALLDFCNDNLKLEDYKGKIDIEPSKKYPYLPAVKIARFGVSKIFQRMHIGTYALNLVKSFFINDNRTGCRFITVDAYNKPEVIKFYASNDFTLITERDRKRRHRAMFFDLIRLNNIKN